MVLRLTFLTLVLTNIAYGIWVSGWLSDYEFASGTKLELERVAEQINPEAIRVISSNKSGKGLVQNSKQNKTNIADTLASQAQEVAAHTANKSNTINHNNNPNAKHNTQAPTMCLQTGPYSAAEIAELTEFLKTAPNGKGWEVIKGSKSNKAEEAWMIYMGKYDSEKQLEKKKKEVEDRNVSMYALPADSWNYGISLGQFKTQEAAQTAMKELNIKGIRTAKVVAVTQLEVKSNGDWIKFAAADEKIKIMWQRAGSKAKPLDHCT